MDFAKRKNRDIVSSTNSMGNGPGSSTLNDILNSETSSSDISWPLARRELNNFYGNNSSSDIGDSTQFLLLTDMGSVQGKSESSISEVERIDLGSSEDPDPSILSTRDLEPQHKTQKNLLSDNENSGGLEIVRNEKTGSYHFKVKYNPNK